jgi:predicted NAD/FAD-binding protein
MKIAVIGAGISGLTVAFQLSRRHAIELFEANDYPGGHTNTVDVDFEGEQHAIDTGFVVFNDRTYPHFVTMLDELEVRSRPAPMSFSVRCDRTGLEYCGSSLSGLFAQRRNLVRPGFWRMVRDILRFNREAHAQTSFGATGARCAPRTVGEFLEDGRYSREFAEQYLLPIGSAIWSCPIGLFREFPIRSVVEFFRNHGLLQLRDRPTWRVIEGGARNYVAAMLRHFRGRLHARTPIVRVVRHPDRVVVTTRNRDEIAVDHVVFACHSDQALRILSDPGPVERQVLGAFPYQRNIALLHTDKSMLPRRRKAWASWNYHLPRRESPCATITYCMNIIQSIRSRHVFNVSLNGAESIDPAKVLGSFVYEHPVFTADREAAQARHSELIDVNRTSFCGAYWRNGFHEDGVWSALAVCRALERGGEKRARQAMEYASANGRV